jgi:two-component system KDP operon response regulator KdpE
LPLLVISAQGSDHTKVGLFDDGADDYLVKPFGLDELLARMRAALRHRSIKQQPGQNMVRIGDLAIDMLNWKVERAGKVVHLTPTEFNLLARLVRSAGQVVTHKQLLVDVWGEAYADHTHYLRMYMAQLRSKLETDPSRPKMLHTETGVGYRLQETG